MAADARSSSGKVPLRETKEKLQDSRIKKLKRRISASFGRLSLTKEGPIPECDQESEQPSCNGLSWSQDEAFSDPGSDINGHVTNGKQPWTRTQSKPAVVPRATAKPPVKRHYSAGDMLVSNAPQIDAVNLQRPKSEGHAYSRQHLSKRASSCGGKSPLGQSDSYRKLEQLGEGSYATVYKGIGSVSKQVVALKEIRLQEEEGAPFTAIREASLLKGLRHANIVTLHDIIHTKDTLTFVFEFVNTDLSQYLELHQGGINYYNVKIFTFQLLRGLSCCHHKRILHRDLKPQNLLISEIGELKLADFGLARAKSIPSRTYSHEVVTLWYRPPDVLLGSTDYSTSLDIWGVGCIFTEMISGLAAFPGMKDAYDQLDKIFKVLGTPTERTWEGVSRLPHYNQKKFGMYSSQPLSICIQKLSLIPQAPDLASKLLQMEPTKRLSADSAMKHEYFSDLPPMIHALPDTSSVFDIPGIKLQPEMDSVSCMKRSSGRSGIRTTLKI
ncbi:cyclin-dependent kinase 14-like [Gigantopelta aegis]|uniref:cyclin-dependent kinase 14-like n=1 Tax=Gigantopelta aegis TaxID=1735272 RepID=UPI001B88C016|nr:cyclin-dependent kinase 14-like [Gigantopelta aegis]